MKREFFGAKMWVGISFLVFLATSLSAPVLNIPGYGPWDSDVFAGYIQLNSSNALFYVFVESEDDPVSAPIVVWLQGGPCW